MPDGQRDGHNVDDVVHSESAQRTIPPTLKPFLDNLPIPPPTASLSLSLSSSDSTPPASHRVLTEHKEHTPTKIASVFELGDKDSLDEECDHDLANEDEEFKSHYSRQSSPASSTASDGDDDSDGGDGDDGDDDPRPEADIDAERETDRVNELGLRLGLRLSHGHRVNSMPASASVEDHQYGFQGNLPMSRSTTALSRGPPPIPPPLYPPFYNKPPNPLPPSPSLTSLLRPPSILNRSATSTRPTSPDSSDVETPNDTEAQVAQQARRANPLPPTAPKVPTYEYYGFVLYLASSIAFLMYILWSYLPSPFLQALGVTYYPDRWWALAIPAWIVIVLVYIYVALACYNVEYLTLSLQRVETMVDEAGSVAILDENGRLRKGGSKRYVAELHERKKRELMAQTWDRKKKGGGGGGSGRGSKKKEKRDKEREKEKEDEWYGYRGEVTEQGVASGLSWKQIWNEGTDAVLDVPLGGVCEVLYGEGSLM